jgi:hypothetical protein
LLEPTKEQLATNPDLDQSAGSSITATLRSPIGTPADQQTEPTAEPATFDDIRNEYNAYVADYNTELKD